MPTTVISDQTTTLEGNERNLVLTDKPSSLDTFENFDLGPIADGENGWKHAGTHDQEIVDIGGNKMLRMSSDPHSGDFGGPYSPALPATAGEPSTTAEHDTQYLRFEFRAVDPVADNSRLEIDFGRDDGSDRNNFLAIESIEGSGIRIAVNEPLLDGSWTNDDFAGFTGNRELVSGIDPSVAHTLEMRVTYLDGQNNDVIEIFLDGELIGTSTTFENLRDFEGGTHADNAEANQTSRVFFRANAGDPVTATQDGPGGENKGFYIDNVETGVGSNDIDGTGNERANAILGNSGDNTLSGLDGNDFLSGDSGNDSLIGGGGKDVLSGDQGDDTIIGGDGKDELIGGAGSDVLRGSADPDSLVGGASDGGSAENTDTVSGGGGKDSFIFRFEVSGNEVGASTENMIITDPGENETLVFDSGGNPDFDKRQELEDLVNVSDDGTDVFVEFTHEGGGTVTITLEGLGEDPVVVGDLKDLSKLMQLEFT